MSLQSQPPQPPPVGVSKRPTPITKIGMGAQKLLQNIWEPLDILGYGLMGDLWRTVYLSVQDAISLGILLQLPSFVAKVIIGKDFASFDVCLKENALGVSCYACFLIVTSDFCLWIILAGRIAARFWSDLRELRRGK